MSAERTARSRWLSAAAATGLLAAGLLVGHGPAIAAESAVADRFDRSMSAGLGRADTGGAYALSGATGNFRVGGGYASMILREPNTSLQAVLPQVVLRDSEQAVRVTSDTWPSGFGYLASLVTRQVGQASYRARLRFSADGAARLSLARTDGSGAESVFGGSEPVLAESSFYPNRWYHLRAEVQGINPTTLRAKAWPADMPEPGAWGLVAQDSTPALQAAGSPGLHVYVGGDATSMPTVHLEDFSVRPLAAVAAPAPAVAPTPEPSRPAQGSSPIGTASFPVPASNAVFVAPWGSDAADGTAIGPWRTLGKAVAAAKNGSTVVARRGVYHESVVFPYGKRLTLQNYPGEAVWLDGSESVTGWVASGSAWRRTNWTHRFDSTDPTSGGGDHWSMTSSAYPAAPYPDMLFVDGVAQRQVLDPAAVGAGTFYSDVKDQALVMGTDPRGRDVRAATLSEAIYVNQGHGSVVRGIGVQRYATPLNRYGAVKLFADDVTLEQVLVRDTATRGIGVAGRGVTVRSSTVERSGQLGIGAHQSDGLTVADSVISDSNVEHFNPSPVAGGIKVTASRQTIFRNNAILDTEGNGLWLDESAYDSTVVSNTVQRSTEHGIHVEISGRTLIADNLVTDNRGSGLRLAETNDVQIWNNTLGRNRSDIDIIDGPRVASDPSTPGHDWRHPNDPDITWVVSGVVVRNNLLSEVRPGSTSLFGVEDGTRSAKGGDMVNTDYNAYYRSTSRDPRWVINWANYGGAPSMQVFTTLDQFRQSTGQELHGMEVRDASDPFVVNAAGGDWRTAPDSPAVGKGAPLSPDVAAKLAVPPNQPVDIGRLDRGRGAPPS